MNLFLWWHLHTNSDRFFSSNSGSSLMVLNFSVRHKSHLLEPQLWSEVYPAIIHLISWWVMSLLGFQFLLLNPLIKKILHVCQWYWQLGSSYIKQWLCWRKTIFFRLEVWCIHFSRNHVICCNRNLRWFFHCDTHIRKKVSFRFSFLGYYKNQSEEIWGSVFDMCINVWC